MKYDNYKLMENVSNVDLFIFFLCAKIMAL
jgi:hypothetical protein